MFKGVVDLVIAPFFGIKTMARDTEDSRGEEEEQSFGKAWRLIGEEQTRGKW